MCIQHFCLQCYNVTVVIVISILQHRVKITETGEVIDVSDEDIEKVSITV